MLRRLFLSIVAMGVLPLAAMLPGSGANAATTATCTDGVAVTQFAFNPPSVAPGSNSALTLVLQNCTSQTIQGSTVWFGEYVGQSGQNCLTLDPLPPFQYTIAPGGTYTLTNSYGDVPTSCPTSLNITANVNVNGVTGTVTSVTATLKFTGTSCTNGIAVDQFSFNPATVAGGQASTLTLVLQNCTTNQTIQGLSSWSFKFTWAGTGLPPGCAQNLDPIQFTYSMPPGGTATSTANLSNPFAGCLATGTQATANVSENGVTGTAATATANLVITQSSSGGCHVTYAPNNWQGGFTANVTIANKGSSAINGWTLTFAFPGDQKITNAWNAAVTQTGTAVTAANMSYNAAIAPGGSQSFGFQGTWATNDTTPASFSLNGAACT